MSAALRPLRQRWADLDEDRRLDVQLVAGLVLLSLLPFAVPEVRAQVALVPRRQVAPQPLLLATTAAQALPLLARRSRPVPVLLVVTAAFTLVQGLALFPTAAELAVLCASYALTAHGRGRQWWWLLVPAVVPLAVLVATVPAERPLVSPFFVAAVVTVLAVAPATVGVYVRRRREAAAAALAERLAHARVASLPARPPASTTPEPSMPSRLAAPLTPREREVLDGIMRGLSNTQIGAELFLSPETVKTHVGRILRKLAVPDRTAAAVLAERHGLVQRHAPAGPAPGRTASGSPPTR